MIRLDQPPATVRRLLRLLRRRPHALERDAVAQRLREALDASNCREALLRIIDLTFGESADDHGWREILVRCDVQGQKGRAAAATMHLSLRQFYRRRAEAIDALAVYVERIDELQSAYIQDPPPMYCASCYRRIVGAPIRAVAGSPTQTHQALQRL